MTLFTAIHSLPIVLQFGGGFRPPTDVYIEDVDTDPFGQVVQFLSNLIGFLTILGAIFFIVQFILGAFSWLTAGGDTGKVDKARNQLLNGIIGLVIIVMSYSIVALIGGVLGINLINLQDTLETIVPSAGPGGG